MGDLEDHLHDIVVRAIGEQLAAADAPRSSAVDAEVQRSTAARLVRDALAAGRFGQVRLAQLRPFSGGNTAMLVAQLESSLSFVVKVDRSPSLVTEARLLQQLADDPRLPAAARQAFPRVYAVDDDGPIYGYLMENLDAFTTFAAALTGASVPGGADAGDVLRAVWGDVLAPAYAATASDRLVPNVAADYFGRVVERLSAAAAAGHAPAPDEPLVIAREADEAVELPAGWGPAVERAQQLLAMVAPGFSTFVHGDPNPENLLWRREGSNIEVRLIDPKDWRLGDYLFDAAKIGHYLAVTSPVEQFRPEVDVERGGRTVVRYATEVLDTHRALEAQLADLVAATVAEQFPADAGSWATRYELALAANLLGIAGPRLSSANSAAGGSDAALGWIALGEGLRLLDALDRR